VSSVTLACFIFTMFASAKPDYSIFGSLENSWTKTCSCMSTVTQWLVLGFSAHTNMIFFSRFNLHRVWSFLWYFWFGHLFSLSPIFFVKVMIRSSPASLNTLYRILQLQKHKVTYCNPYTFFLLWSCHIRMAF